MNNRNNLDNSASEKKLETKEDLLTPILVGIPNASSMLAVNKLAEEQRNSLINIIAI